MFTHALNSNILIKESQGLYGKRVGLVIFVILTNPINKKAPSTIDEAYVSHLVGNRGFEPLTSSTSMKRSSQMS